MFIIADHPAVSEEPLVSSQKLLPVTEMGKLVLTKL